MSTLFLLLCLLEHDLYIKESHFVPVLQCIRLHRKCLLVQIICLLYIKSINTEVLYEVSEKLELYRVSETQSHLMVPYSLHRSQKQINSLGDLPESQVRILGVGY